MDFEKTTKVKEFEGKFYVVEIEFDNKGFYELAEDFEDHDACDTEEEAKELQRDIEIENATCVLLDAVVNEFDLSRREAKDKIKSALENL